MTPQQIQRRLNRLGKSRYWLAKQVAASGEASEAAVYQYLKGWYKRPSYGLISSMDNALREAEKNSENLANGG